MNSQPLTPNPLLRLGYLIPLLFWLTLFIGGWMRGNYHHFRDLVSELGRRGTSTQYLFTAGLVTSALLSLPFLLALHRRAKTLGLSTWPVLILLPAFSCSMFGAAVVPLPLSLHGTLGSPAMLLTASPLLALLLWKDHFGRPFLILTTTILLITALGYLVFTPALDTLPGLKQRFAHTGWSLWFVYLAGLFLKPGEMA